MWYTHIHKSKNHVFPLKIGDPLSKIDACSHEENWHTHITTSQIIQEPLFKKKKKQSNFKF